MLLLNGRLCVVAKKLHNGPVDSTVKIAKYSIPVLHINIKYKTS